MRLEVRECRSSLAERRETAEDREGVPVLRMDDRPGGRIPKGAGRGVPERRPESSRDGTDPGLPGRLSVGLAEPARELGGEAERTDIDGVVVGDGRAATRNVAVVGVGCTVDEQPGVVDLRRVPPHEETRAATSARTTTAAIFRCATPGSFSPRARSLQRTPHGCRRPSSTRSRARPPRARRSRPTGRRRAQRGQRFRGRPRSRRRRA